jgi:V/A-type H+-transporting ATPase subunit I
MAILKMQMVNIIGILSDFDKVVAEHIIDKDIHIENSLTMLEDTDKVYAFDDDNKNDELRRQIFSLIQISNININENKECCMLSMEQIGEEIRRIEKRIQPFAIEKVEINKKMVNDKSILRQIEPIIGIDIDLTKLFEFEFIQFRFGKMPKTNYQNLQIYLDDMEAFFISTKIDNDYVWGIYFVAEVFKEKIDSVFQSLNFERVSIPWDVYGTPIEAFEGISGRYERLKNRMVEIDQQVKATLIEEKSLLISMYNKMCDIKRSNEVKKNSSHTRETFCISGWMQEETVNHLELSLEKQPNLLFISETPENVNKVSPPTKMKNNFFVRPFELFIKMYGLPGYKEFDPTIVLAITYAIMFGAMFGDLGQGFILTVGGFLFAKYKKSQLGAVIGTLGLSAMFFGGVIYGSVFGVEDKIIHGLISPMHEINSVLIYAIIIGVIVLSIVMIINIVKGIKNKDMQRAIFGQNGIAGVVLYWSIILVGLQLIINGGKVPLWIIIVCIILPIVLIILQQPLTHLLQRRKDWIPQNTGMFIVESFFELFEILLSYFTNTLSFLRIGAFALTHVGMMSVVFTLANMIGNSGSWVVYILGNVLVIVLEGFIAGIQVLRLEFYEVFSRFYAGDGKEFKPLKNIEIND